MNVSFHALPLETQVQIIVVYIDMALVAIGRFLRVAVPFFAVVMLFFLLWSRRRRRPR